MNEDKGMSESWNWSENADHVRRPAFPDRSWRSRSNLTLNNARFPHGNERHVLTADYLNFMAQFYNEQLNHLACHPSLMAYYYQSLLALSNWRPRYEDHTRLLYGSRRQAASSYERPDFYRSRQWRHSEVHSPLFGQTRWRRERSSRGSWRRNHESEEENEQRRSDTFLAYSRRQEEAQPQDDFDRTECRERTTARKILPSTCSPNAEPAQKEKEESGGSTLWRNSASASNESSFPVDYDEEPSTDWTTAVRKEGPCFEPRTSIEVSPSSDPDSRNVESEINDLQQSPDLSDVDAINSNCVEQNSDGARCSDEQTNPSTTEIEKKSSALEPGNWFSQEEQQFIVNMFAEVDVRHEQQMTKNKQLEGEQNQPVAKNISPASVKECTERETSNQAANRNSPSGDFHHGEEHDLHPIHEESSSSEDGLVLILPQSCSAPEKLPEYSEEFFLDPSGELDNEKPLEADLQQEGNDVSDWSKFCSGWGKEVPCDSQCGDEYCVSTSRTSVSETFWMPTSNECVNENMSMELKQLLGIQPVADAFQTDGSMTSNYERYYPDLTLDDELELQMAGMILESHDVDENKAISENEVSASKENDHYYQVDENVGFDNSYPGAYSAYDFNPAQSPELNEVNSKVDVPSDSPTFIKETCGSVDTNGFITQSNYCSVNDKVHNTVNSPQNSFSSSPIATASEICQNSQSNDVCHFQQESESRAVADVPDSTSSNTNLQKTSKSPSLAFSSVVNSGVTLSQKTKTSANDTATEYLKKLLGVHQHKSNNTLSNKRSSKSSKTREPETNDNAQKDTEKSMSSTDILKSILGIPRTESTQVLHPCKEEPVQQNDFRKDLSTVTNENRIEFTKIVENNDEENITIQKPSVKRTDSEGESKSKEKCVPLRKVANDTSKEWHNRNRYSSQTTRHHTNSLKENGNSTQDPPHAHEKLPADSTENSTYEKKKKTRKFKKSRNHEHGTLEERKDILTSSPTALQGKIPVENSQALLKSIIDGQAHITTQEKGEIDESQKSNVAEKKQKWKRNWSRTRPDRTLQSTTERDSENFGNKGDLKDSGRQTKISYVSIEKSNRGQYMRSSKTFPRSQNLETDNFEQKKSLQPKNDTVEFNDSDDTARKEKTELNQGPISIIKEDKEQSAAVDPKQEIETRPKELTQSNAYEKNHLNKDSSHLGSTRPKRWEKNRQFNPNEKPVIRRIYYRSYRKDDEAFYTSKPISKWKNLLREQDPSKTGRKRAEDRRYPAESTADGSVAVNSKSPKDTNLDAICKDGSGTKMDSGVTSIHHMNADVTNSIAKEHNSEGLKSRDSDRSGEDTKMEKSPKHEPRQPLLFNGEFGFHPIKCKMKSVSEAKFAFSLCDLNECKELKRQIPVLSPKRPPLEQGFSAFELTLFRSRPVHRTTFDFNICRGTFGDCIPSVIKIMSMKQKEGKH